MKQCEVLLGIVLSHGLKLCATQSFCHMVKMSLPHHEHNTFEFYTLRLTFMTN
jgi:hypothetical protein